MKGYQITFFTQQDHRRGHMSMAVAHCLPPVIWDCAEQLLWLPEKATISIATFIPRAPLNWLTSHRKS